MGPTTPTTVGTTFALWVFHVDVTDKLFPNQMVLFILVLKSHICCDPLHNKKSWPDFSESKNHHPKSQLTSAGGCTRVIEGILGLPLPHLCHLHHMCCLTCGRPPPFHRLQLHIGATVKNKLFFNY